MQQYIGIDVGGTFTSKYGVINSDVKVADLSIPYARGTPRLPANGGMWWRVAQLGL